MKTVRHVWILLLAAHLAAVLVAVARGGWAGFCTMAVLHLAWVRITLWPGSTPFGKAVESFPLTTREVILTIDDGPCGDTGAVLDLLDRYQARAVFFLIGSRASARPGDVAGIIARGHQIQNHTLTHPSATFWAAGPARLRREIAGGSEILTKLTGQTPQWFRAPAGFRNPFTAPILRECGLRCMGWAARGFDTRRTDPAKVLLRMRPEFRPGVVLLVHQGHPQSLAVIEAVLVALKEDGFGTCLP
ncbi:MAG: polysaccharide deacetylase family protein [Verrucomicrobiales bacterium]|nr:polysaccharide deacetylase family protein [Verrucomicrobiales bacterium]